MKKNKVVKRIFKKLIGKTMSVKRQAVVKEVKNEVIAVDLGGTHMRVSRVIGRKIIDYASVNTPKEKTVLLTTLCDMIARLKNSSTRGIGVGCAGFIQEGVIVKSVNLPLSRFDLKKYLAKRFRVPVEVINDAHAHALAELHYGVQKKNFVLLTLGTGIGGGIVIDGKLQFRNGGGEVGHMILDNGKDFESLSASKALYSLTKKEFGKAMMISELVAEKNVRSQEVLMALADYLGQGIANLCAIFNPEVVVLAGGMREGGMIFLHMVEASYMKHTFLPKTTRVVWSHLAHPGTLGASLLLST